MAFLKGNQIGKGTRFGAKNGNPSRPRSRIGVEVEEFIKAGNELPTRDDIRRMYLMLLAKTKPEIENVFNDDKQSILARVCAKSILGRQGFESIEKILDRVFGKPTQVVENYNENNEVKLPKIIIGGE